VRLEGLYRKVHFVTAAAGLAEFSELAQMSSVFEALLFSVTAKPEFFTPSVRETITQSVKFMEELFNRAEEKQGELPPAQVLVVDDEPVTNRLIVSALHSARLHASSVQDAAAALEAVGQTQYDLLLLDVQLPGMDGFELCQRVRALPGYEKTPIIYVTLHGDFETRAQGALSGGNDLIAKPIFPMELATKAVMHLLQVRRGGG